MCAIRSRSIIVGTSARNVPAPNPRKDDHLHDTAEDVITAARRILASASSERARSRTVRGAGRPHNEAKRVVDSPSEWNYDGQGLAKS